MVCHVTQENYRIVCKARQLLRREKWGVSGGGHIPRLSLLHPQHISGSMSCPKLEPDPVPAARDPSSPSESHG